MGQQQSKDELLYQQVNYGNIEGIKSLCREGAGLEWIDKEGKTPLIAACMNPELLNVAKTLIELGANINAYRPGSHAGTPLHHAAKRGLDQTVNLLLSHGANALVMNDDCQTPLEVARVKGYGNVVRLIEHHICFFSGWLRELYLPGFLEVLAPQWLSKKNWVVVIPCGSRNPTKPLKLELALYSGHQEAQPRTVIALWKAKIEEPKLNQPDPVLVIFDNSSKTRYKFASANDGDKQQLQCFYNACRGIRQVLPPPLPPNAPLLPATAPPLTAEDVGNPNGWGNSLDNTGQNRRDQMGGPAAASSGSLDEPIKDAYNGWGISEAGPSSNPTQHIESQKIHTTHVIPEAASSVPSAPPIPEEIADDGRIHYPAIDSSPIDVSMPSMENGPARTSEVKEDGVANSSCVICLDAPVEGACIPCGHMAGCMSCLNAIEAKKWGCPVCRAKIDKVIRLYAV